jgi:hypothetical protein
MHIIHCAWLRTVHVLREEKCGNVVTTSRHLDSPLHSTRLPEAVTMRVAKVLHKHSTRQQQLYVTLAILRQLAETGYSNRRGLSDWLTTAVWLL